MGITSRSARPSEWAAKINHTHLIKDPFIKNFIENCDLPKNADEITVQDLKALYSLQPQTQNTVKHILAVDGGYTTVEVKKNFPSSQIAFFQFGALLFNTEDLESLSEKPFIFPSDMEKLNDLQRFKLAIPIKNIITKSQNSLKDSIRKILYDFFMNNHDNENFMETLKWFIFEEYKSTPRDVYDLASHPNKDVGTGIVQLNRNNLKSDFTFDSTDGIIYLTDVFRLHEVIDEELGAGGILGYITRLIEQLIIVHFIKFIYVNKPTALSEYLFIADGPLSFSGQTARMHVPMRELCNTLQKYELKMVGIEKSGPFVDHALEICNTRSDNPVLKRNTFFLLSNDYIYKYIIPGDSTKMHYGSTSYYSGKVIFHSADGQVIILSVPTPHKNTILNPAIDKYKNLEVILHNVQKLRCAMYDNAIVPIALANKLISLANHPSKVLLEKFAKNTMQSVK